jgi:hypothetical protein
MKSGSRRGGRKTHREKEIRMSEKFPKTIAEANILVGTDGLSLGDMADLIIIRKNLTPDVRNRMIDHLRELNNAAYEGTDDLPEDYTPEAYGDFDASWESDNEMSNDDM